MLTVFPFLEWMCLYRFKDWLLGDLLAGLSVGLVQVPQGKSKSKAVLPRPQLLSGASSSLAKQKESEGAVFCTVDIPSFLPSTRLFIPPGWL